MSDAASKTCETCIHWRRPQDRDGFGNAVSFEADEYDDDLNDGMGGYVNGDRADRLFGECRVIDMGTELTWPPPLAVVRDGSDYRATLYTQAEFGCVMHQEVAQDATGADLSASGAESDRGGRRDGEGLA